MTNQPSVRPLPEFCPPTELIRNWETMYQQAGNNPDAVLRNVAWEAAQWGADHELKTCCEWLELNYNYTRSNHPLRTARRPKPPSLKEQAKFAAAVLRSPDETCSIAELQQHWHTICKALEELPND